MSTRTMGKRETLDVEVWLIEVKGHIRWWPMDWCALKKSAAKTRLDYLREQAPTDKYRMRRYIRADLQRVARQVRKLDDSDGGKHKQTIHFTCGYYQAIHDVLALLKEAGR